mgnify:CR=1 FL=1|jgi:glycosyltransferase involved in cell wall biosynthesis
MKFSVIVPVYNVEKYLQKCINSILNQNYKDYELILVDDGSKDKSGEICDQYANMDTNHTVICIHKKNGGLSDARNTGIVNAKGDFLVFVDSDDWIDENALYNIASVIKDDKIDVVVSKFVEVFEEKSVIKDPGIVSVKNATNDRIIEYMFKNSENTWPAQKYIISKKFIIENGLKFKYGVLHEDLDWTTKVFLCDPCCVVMDDEWYYHRMGRSGSITNIVKEKNITDVIDMASIFYKQLHTSKEDREIMILERIMESVYGSINKYKYCSKQDKLIVEEKVRENMAIFSVHPKFKYTLFYVLLRMLGSKFSLKLLSVF